jgi:hypothetical protein
MLSILLLVMGSVKKTVAKNWAVMAEALGVARFQRVQPVFIAAATHFYTNVEAELLLFQIKVNKPSVLNNYIFSSLQRI